MKKGLAIIMIISVLYSCSHDNTKENDISINKTEVSRESENIKTDKDFFSQGKQIAKATGGSMKSKLMSAMKSGGVKNAVNFCNQNAYNITDSLSKYYNVDIKRTSTKIRNENNKATEEELAVISSFEDLIAKGGEISPIVKDENEFYAPIKMSGACLKCHGTIGQEISNEDYSIIKDLYKTDKAIDYKVEDLRGIWHITFNK